MHHPHQRIVVGLLRMVMKLPLVDGESKRRSRQSTRAERLVLRLVASNNTIRQRQWVSAYIHSVLELVPALDTYGKQEWVRQQNVYCRMVLMMLLMLPQTQMPTPMKKMMMMLCRCLALPTNDPSSKQDGSRQTHTEQV